MQLYNNSHRDELFPERIMSDNPKEYDGKVNIGGRSITNPGPKVIKLFSCSTQLSMKFFLLINVKMPTIVGILTFMSGKNSILDLSEPKKKPNFLIFFYFGAFTISCSTELSMKKVL